MFPDRAIEEAIPSLIRSPDDNSPLPRPSWFGRDLWEVRPPREDIPQPLPVGDKSQPKAVEEKSQAEAGADKLQPKGVGDKSQSKVSDKYPSKEDDSSSKRKPYATTTPKISNTVKQVFGLQNLNSPLPVSGPKSPRKHFMTKMKDMTG
ncbi:hypothetical protein AAMO2058_001518300 [Amorphochlora amoebiformis]